MATQIELQNELKKLGVKLTGDENYRELQALLKTAREQAEKGDEADKKDKDDKKDGAENAAASQAAKSAPVESVYVWVKSRVYVDDKKRIEPGLFIFDDFSAYPRLARAHGNAVEIFEGSIPALKLAEIAKWCGVNPDKYRSSDEKLLELIVTVPHYVR